MDRYWEYIPLEKMSSSQWESLCDGCGRCCLHKCEDEETGEIYYTDVACHLLDIKTARCKDYNNRSKRVSSCITLQVNDLAGATHLPPDCAYRLLSEGHSLPMWHPLLSGTSETVCEAGVSVSNFAVSETYVHPDEIYERIIPICTLSK